ncbi:MAG: hypothetical protein V4739_01115 [Pseudomonadota bacterium]
MSDPLANPAVKKTRRAEPLQPDNPGRGTDVESADDDGQDLQQVDKTAVKRQKGQLDNAIQNTTEGYD